MISGNAVLGDGPNQDNLYYDYMFFVRYWSVVD